MSTKRNTNPIIVGIFVLLGIAIFIVAVFTLGGQQSTFKKAITIRTVFDDVQGLQKGNNVWFSGVKIGTVKQVSFYKNSQVEVDLNINEASQEYIRKNAMAKIGSDGLIGNKIVVIYGGTEASEPVQDGDTLGVERAISSDEMMGTLQANNRNLLDITNDVKVLTQRLKNGEGTVGKLMSDEALLNDLQSVMATLKRASVNTEKLTASVSGYTAQLNRKGSLAYDLAHDTVLVSSLRSTAAQIDAASEKTNVIVNDLSKASEGLTQALNDQSTPVGMLLHDKAAASDIKTTLQNLNTGSRKLDQNMEALQHNFLFRRYFRKKAKEQPADTIIVTGQ